MNFRAGAYFFLKVFLQIIGVVAFVAIAVNLSGQNYYSRNFTIEDGLPSNTVRALFKDSRGIMWIGTSAGLCRFNGREFTIYNSSDGLGAENIFDITEDNKGNLWIGGMGCGISMFDGTRFTNYDEKKGLVCNDVRRVWWSKKFNILLVGTNMGCSVFNGKAFYSLPVAAVSKEYKSLFVIGFEEKNYGVRLFSYGFGTVYCYNPVTHKFTKDTAGSLLDIQPNCNPISGKNGDTIWSWGRTSIQVWNKKCIAKFDSLGQVFHMAADDKKNIWIAAWTEFPTPPMPGGFYMYDGTKVVSLGKQTGISDPGVWTVFYDSIFHTVWVGTLHQGLYRMPLPFIESYGPSWFGLSSMKINAIHAGRDNNIWIATSKDIIRKNPNLGFYIYPRNLLRKIQYITQLKYFDLSHMQFRDKEGSFEKYKKLIAEGKFPYPNPYHAFFAEWSEERILPAGSLYNPAVYNQSRQDIIKESKDTTVFGFLSIGEDSRYNVYVKAKYGLIRFSDKTNYMSPEVISIHQNHPHHVIAFDKTDTLYSSSFWVRGIFRCAIFPEVKYPDPYFFLAGKGNAPDRPIRMYSRGNEIWSASKIGGLYLTLGNKNYAFCKADSSLPRSFNDLCFDGEHNVIAGANNGEVFVFRWDGEQLKLLYKLDRTTGILGKSIRWVKTDRQSNLFIGTTEGLNLVDLKELNAKGKARVRFFSRESGYVDPTAEFSVVDSTGNPWIASEKQLFRLNRKLLFDYTSHVANLLLTGVEINQVPLSQVEGFTADPWFGSPTEKLKLTHDQNNVMFYFDAVNYLDANQQRFRHRLLPVNKQWSEFSSDRKAFFPMLHPGHYTFEIESYSTIDNSQISHLSYVFVILPPFYATWWFILLVSIILAGILVSVWIFRVGQIRKQEKLKASIQLELNNMEMKALKAQMNPHFIFNALNSIQSYILTNNVDKALYYLSMFSKLVRKTLENATKEFVPLGEELEFLNFYIELEKMRFEGQFTNIMECDEDLPLDTTMIPPMIVQPFVENAIKHGLLKLKVAGVLRILVTKVNENQYRVIIEDNGIGRMRAGELRKNEGLIHNSKGLDITNTRIRLLNENGKTGNFSIKMVDLLDAEGHAAGTRVEVNLPLG
ncbi:MAG: histidine kinase [Bacteroidales bacterium]